MMTSLNANSLWVELSREDSGSKCGTSNSTWKFDCSPTSAATPNAELRAITGSWPGARQRHHYLDKCSATTDGHF